MDCNITQYSSSKCRNLHQISWKKEYCRNKWSTNSTFLRHIGHSFGMNMFFLLGNAFWTVIRSIKVKVMKESAAPRAVYVPTATVRMALASTEQQSLAPAAPPSAPETPTPSDRNAPESSNIHEEGDDCGNQSSTCQ